MGAVLPSPNLSNRNTHHVTKNLTTAQLLMRQGVTEFTKTQVIPTCYLFVPRPTHWEAEDYLNVLDKAAVVIGSRHEIKIANILPDPNINYGQCIIVEDKIASDYIYFIISTGSNPILTAKWKKLKLPSLLILSYACFDFRRKGYITRCLYYSNQEPDDMSSHSAIAEYPKTAEVAQEWVIWGKIQNENHRHFPDIETNLALSLSNFNGTKRTINGCYGIKDVNKTVRSDSAILTPGYLPLAEGPKKFGSWTGYYVYSNGGTDEPDVKNDPVYAPVTQIENSEYGGLSEQIAHTTAEHDLDIKLKSFKTIHPNSWMKYDDTISLLNMFYSKMPSGQLHPITPPSKTAEAFRLSELSNLAPNRGSWPAITNLSERALHFHSASNYILCPISLRSPRLDTMATYKHRPRIYAICPDTNGLLSTGSVATMSWNGGSHGTLTTPLVWSDKTSANIDAIHNVRANRVTNVTTTNFGHFRVSKELPENFVPNYDADTNVVMDAIFGLLRSHPSHHRFFTFSELKQPDGTRTLSATIDYTQCSKTKPKYLDRASSVINCNPIGTRYPALNVLMWFLDFQVHP
jgi:hypothetical protein